MLVIQLFGLSSDLRDSLGLREFLRVTLPKAIADFKLLELSPTDISIFAPQDLLSEHQSEEIIVIIQGLFMGKPQRTSAARTSMKMLVAEEVKRFAQEYMPSCKKVEVFLYLFDLSNAHFAELKF